MNLELSKKYVRAKVNKISKKIDQLTDDYTLADFQRKVYKCTGLVVKPDTNEKFVTLHKPFSIKVLDDYVCKDGLYWGISGGYIKTPVAMIKINRRYTQKAMSIVLNAANQMKNIKNKNKPIK